MHLIVPALYAVRIIRVFLSKADMSANPVSSTSKTTISQKNNLTQTRTNKQVPVRTGRAGSHAVSGVLISHPAHLQLTLSLILSVLLISRTLSSFTGNTLFSFRFHN